MNHCVNDIAVQGAAPMFFMDYLATGKLDPDIAEKVVEGIADAWKHNGCALIGGETAEMPGFYPDGEYDLAGFIVGVVDREKIITGKDVQIGDIILGLPRMACTPTDIRWLASCCSKSGIFPRNVRERDQEQSRQRIDAHPQKLLARSSQIGGRPVCGGDGAHHRRRNYGEPAARAAQGTAAVIELGSWPVPPDL